MFIRPKFLYNLLILITVIPRLSGASIKKTEITTSSPPNSHKNSNKYKNVPLVIGLSLGGAALMAAGTYLITRPKQSIVKAKNYRVSVLVVGKKGIGKTSLISRICNGDISGFESDPLRIEEQPPPENLEKYPLVQGRDVTAPIYHYGPFSLKFDIREIDIDDVNNHNNGIYREWNVIIVMFDANDPSFDVKKLEIWNDKIVKTNPKTYVIYFANKIDEYSGRDNVDDIKLNSLMRFVSKLPNAGFVPGSVKTGKFLNGVLRQLIDWGREWGKEVSSLDPP
ncbi:MAG: hypothetical protein NkDv07_0395 [Candidatus Improbicoccus devescovinae]|nr:MAG: hypothetical protein NkDv07_0395 [Candidatus Improbicoccus devescovinae]